MLKNVFFGQSFFLPLLRAALVDDALIVLNGFFEENELFELHKKMVVSFFADECLFCLFGRC